MSLERTVFYIHLQVGGHVSEGDRASTAAAAAAKQHATLHGRASTIVPETLNPRLITRQTKTQRAGARLAMLMLPC